MPLIPFAWARFRSFSGSSSVVVIHMSWFASCRKKRHSNMKSFMTIWFVKADFIFNVKAKAFLFSSNYKRHKFVSALNNRNSMLGGKVRLQKAHRNNVEWNIIISFRLSVSWIKGINPNVHIIELWFDIYFTKINLNIFPCKFGMSAFIIIAQKKYLFLLWKNTI